VSEIEWLNTEEAAKRLGITTRTLYRFMDQGRLPAYRMGRVFRLQMTDIEKFIEDCKVEQFIPRPVDPIALRMIP